MLTRVRRALILALTVGLVCAASATAQPSWRDGDGLHIQSSAQLDGRLSALTFTTAALPKPVDARILLPDGYATHPHQRYPVLYLFDGTSGHASDWTTMGAAEQTTAGLPVIVVMPDITLNGNGGGWCTNWPSGAQSWETFHIDQLLPWVDANLRTIRSRGGRAIAGLSQGGFCSMSYASRHPDMFSVALAYSGAPDIYYDTQARVGAMTIINATEVGLDGLPLNTFFGNPVTDGINWAAHDPATLAPNLRATSLFMYFGNGALGPFDNSINPAAQGIEMLVDEDNIPFHQRLQSLGIPSVYDPYGAGTHSWPYWARDLKWSIGPLMADFADPAPTPAAVDYTSGDDSYSVYGWSVTMHRRARELSTLHSATAQGFSISGSGSATVITPPLFRRGSSYRVTVQGGQAPAETLQLTAPRSRRLTIPVSLGQSNPYPQYTPQAILFGTHIYTSTVAIHRIARHPTPAS